MEDQRIVSLYFERSQEAIAETKKKYGSLCKSLARRLLSSREDVEECVSDALLAVWDSIPPNRPASLAPYIAKITRNIAVSRLEYNRADKRNAALTLSLEELDSCVSAPGGVDEAIGELTLREAIIAFLRSQSPENRKIFIRRYFFFDTPSQIAARYGISQSKVRSALTRTRNKLKEHLIKEEFMYDR